MRAARRTLHISQAELAERCNISTSFVSDIENSRKYPSADTLERIAAALNLIPYQLLLDSEQGGADEKYDRILSLLAELIYATPASHRDPACPRADADGQAEASDHSARRWADYAYAHGGKDGIPFPVDRDTYDRNIAILSEAVRRARVGDSDRTAALRRLGQYCGTT